MRNGYAAFSMLIACAVAGCQGAGGDRPGIATSTAGAADTAALEKLLAYVRNQNTTGFLVIKDNVTLIQQNWAAPDDRLFSMFDYGATDQGELREDVASQQKSFVAVLVGIAIDRGLIDVEQPVSRYLGTGWSKASPEQEAPILVAHILAMNSGLNEKLEYEAPAGTRFFYNTPAYAVSKQILAAASGLSLDAMTSAWLTEPLAMTDTQWRKRPAALGDVDSSPRPEIPRDLAR